MRTEKYHELSRHVLARHECNAVLTMSDISYMREILSTCIASVVSTLSVPLDIENTLCDNGVQYGKNISIVGVTQTVYIFYENRHISAVWHNNDIACVF